MPGDVRRGDGFGHLAMGVDALAHRRDRPRRGRVFRPDLQCGRAQNRLRSELHQHRAAQLGDGAHALGELHRLPGMPPPVLCVRAESLP